MRIHVETGFTVDGRGRLRAVNEPGGPPAPRFFIGQTREGNQWWFRYDLDDEAVSALEALCRRETVPHDLDEPALDPEPYASVLRERAPIENLWAGPVYAFPEPMDSAADPVLIQAEDRDILRRYCAEWLEDVGDCQPFAVLPRDGHAVSVCATVRATATADEAGVETHPAFRGQGCAGQVVATWAAAVQRLGRTPFYSTSWDNEASQAVAKKSGLIQFGSDLHIR